MNNLALRDSRDKFSTDAITPGCDVPQAHTPPHRVRWLRQAQTAWEQAPDNPNVRPRLGDFLLIAATVHGLGAGNHGVCWPTDYVLAREAGLKNNAKPTVQRTLRLLDGAGMLARATGELAFWTVAAHGGSLPDGRYRALILTGWSVRLAESKPEAEAIRRNRAFRGAAGRVMYDAAPPGGFFQRVALVVIGSTDQSPPKEEGPGRASLPVHPPGPTAPPLSTSRPPLRVTEAVVDRLVSCTLEQGEAQRFGELYGQALLWRLERGDAFDEELLGQLADCHGGRRDVAERIAALVQGARDLRRLAAPA